MLRDLQTAAAGLRPTPRRRRRRSRRRSTRRADESALVGAFIGRVGVEPVRGSQLVDVTFISEDPKFAADAVNTLIDEYVEQNLEIKLRVDAEHARLAGQGARQAAEARSRRASGRSPNTAKSRTRCRSTTSRTSSLSRLNQLNDARDQRAQRRSVQKESLYNQVKAIAGRHVARRDSDHRARTRRCRRARASCASCSAQKVQLLGALRRQAPAGASNVNAQLQDAQRQLDIEIAERGAVGQERVRDGGARGADARAEPRRRRRPTRRI